MPKMQISRSIEIDADANSIFPHLNDFNKWTPWSPWLLMEPEARVSVTEDAKSYEWEGKRVGSGNMKVLDEVKNQEIHYDLNFLKPWKSHAKTSFYLDEKDGKTTATWTMDSKLPFFLFWMKKSMEAFVGADYERGLDMLKATVEKGSIPSKVDLLDPVSYDGCHFIGIKTSSNLDVVDKQMASDFGKLWKYAAENPDQIAGEGLSIYHNWDIINRKVSYTAAFPIKELLDTVPEGFITGSIPKTKAQVLRHTGSYYHLGNAWSMGYTMMRNKEFKQNKKVDPFEVYQNNPSNAQEEELLTDVHFPCK